MNLSAYLKIGGGICRSTAEFIHGKQISGN